ncbi:DUF420 domain-containing protein [Lacipirellula sp.]|uniref:DUF420 domain-containing protein n=1 Tax=Lacipirellula sp. TaxID=2691419 RepID=UPI003D0FD26C
MPATLELAALFPIGRAGEWLPTLPLAVGGHPLVHLNAALNSIATVLLIAALIQIKRKRELAHGRLMLAALAVSAAFLVSYVTYHLMVGRVNFTHPGVVKLIYYVILATHVVLAFTVPFLAIAATIYGANAVGWGRAAAWPAEKKAESRAKHLKVVRWAFPIWLYVSVTGVVVYLMLYHIWPSAELTPTLNADPPPVSAPG